MKNLIIYTICLLVALVVNIKIYSVYSGYEAASSEFLERAKVNVAKLTSSPATENESKLTKLSVLYADREVEIYLARRYAYLLMALFTALIFSVPITQQLTRRSKSTAESGA